MSQGHYKPIHDQETGEWFFTSPIGRHAARESPDACKALILRVLPGHIERANGTGHEAELLHDYFLTLKKPPVLPTAPGERPPDPPRCRIPHTKHRWSGRRDDATCTRCQVEKQTFDRARMNLIAWKRLVDLQHLARLKETVRAND